MLTDDLSNMTLESLKAQPHPSSIQRVSHHDTKSTQRRRQCQRPCPSRSCLSTLSLTLFIILTCCLPLAAAASSDTFDIPRLSHEEQRNHTLSQLAKLGTILVDHKDNVQIPGSNRASELRRRDGSSSSVTSSATIPSSTTATASTSTAKSSTTSSAPSPLPSAYDTGLGTNFTSLACPSYISNFLSNSVFKSCLPISMLVDSSVSFFRAEQSLVRITQVLDASCSANSTICNAYLSGLASNLTNVANCGTEYTAGNAIVQQVQNGLLAYNTMYTATCLKSPETNNYCFADAITNATSPTDSYVYFLPLNQSLVGGSQPTCNTCLQNVMSVFWATSANRSTAVSSTYTGAARLINGLCGPSFVNATLPQALVSGAVRDFSQSSGIVATVAVIMLALVFI